MLSAAIDDTLQSIGMVCVAWGRRRSRSRRHADGMFSICFGTMVLPFRRLTFRIAAMLTP